MRGRSGLCVRSQVGTAVAGIAASSGNRIGGMQQRTQESCVAEGIGLGMAGVAECSRRRGNMGCRFCFRPAVGTVMAGIATIGRHAGMIVPRPQERGVVASVSLSVT